MPKVVYDSSKGLYQTTGEGVDFASSVTAGDGLASRAPVTSITDATYTVAVAESGTIFTLNKADGIAITLPAAEAGLVYEFHVGTTFTSTWSISAASSADTFQGAVMSIDKDELGSVVLLNEGIDTTGWNIPAAADYRFTANADADGRFIGGRIRLRAISAAIWLIDGTLFSDGTATHQFS